MLKRTPLISCLFATIMAITLANSKISIASTGDIAESAEETLKTIKGYLVEKRNEAVEYGKELLQKSDQAIEKLQEKANVSTGEAQKAYQKEIGKLKQKRAEMAEKLDELEKASADSWDAAKDGLAEAYASLMEAYQEALARFE